MPKLPVVPLTPFQAKFLVEGIGTFVLALTVFLAEVECGAGALNGTTKIRNLAPIAAGFILAVMVFTFGYISGGHFNPAVTLGIMFVNIIRIDQALAYIIAQCIGAFMGAGFGVLLTGPGPQMPAPEVYRGLPEFIFRGFVGEAIFTGALVTVVLHVACSKQKDNHFYGFAVGMTVMASAYAVGGVSGGCFNPALATGFQVVKCFAGYCTALLNLWLYWGAPAAGALGASIAFKMVHPKIGQQGAAGADKDEPAPRHEQLY
uniref:Aquaporin n=1 Tax=Neobodo designis TaxID=312471 RepID=A0A7S1QLY8_NEODS|mmetsp:Transcript_48457/g.149571  ORF Transcript_48457/g.149571 Transcript_48457/m.149571 type:complete len:261 (+) Transcript_48457:53-835(+)|eukprot:CAMPEP_0174828296 /NCGR_PEP_ID=MMETSP1114-20130205/1241_1 /TAXON_ID=312471 /ORGANISM="Neobodo designis, Strain CCAP 1951/1" /LENGTH=260 /DNA_ID=CAMNT_0016062009 /DNA_START=53 /DNA_END=835 /DNA_ORIENTATION=-